MFGHPERFETRGLGGGGGFIGTGAGVGDKEAETEFHGGAVAGAEGNSNPEKALPWWSGVGPLRSREAGRSGERYNAGMTSLTTPLTTSLTHIDERGQANMVDVSTKDDTVRRAVARSVVRMQPQTLAAILDNRIHKREVLATAGVDLPHSPPLLQGRPLPPLFYADNLALLSTSPAGL